ncbi:MAG: hypothetical protein U0W24_08280 [Bacteroidales bacterium]
MEKNINKNSTKTEILEAYTQLLEQLEDKEGQQPEKQQTLKLEKEIVAKAGNAPTEQIIKGISELKTLLTGSLDKLESSMINEYKKFENLQQAIKIEQKNIEELYGIKVQANSLNALILAQKENKEKFEKLMQEEKTAFEKEMELKREGWKKETEETEKLFKEQKAEKEKLRKREEEEYAYKLAQERKKESDAQAEKQMQAEKKMAAKLADFEKSIAEREAKVVAAEAELENLRAKTSDFPAELEKAIKNAEKLVTDNLTRQFDFEKQLSQKHTEGELKLKDQTIQTLNARIKELEQSIKDLNSKVTNADSSVKDIAIKAIESSGKMRILETVGKKEERD